MSLRSRFAPYRFALVAVCWTSAAGVSPAAAQVLLNPPAAAPAVVPDDDVVVARVDDEPITFRDVKQQLVGTLQGRPVPDQAMPLVLSQSLEQVIARRLIAAEMRRKGMQPTDDERKQAEENFAKNLTRRGLSRDDYLRQNFLTEAELEKVRFWETCWNRYARELLTDADLEQFFEAHRRDYDGTQLRVSHILLRIEGTQDQGTVAGAVRKATAIRDQILSGATTFADAALRHSAGPSREQGGDLGFIPRRERMVEEFSAAAFRLKKGEISPPVLTPFGVHLITVTDEQPGTLKWQDVREQLITAAQVPAFHQLAAHLRKTAKVEYTGVLPRVEPQNVRPQGTN